jgi:hypothetical protein
MLSRSFNVSSKHSFRRLHVILSLYHPKFETGSTAELITRILQSGNSRSRTLFYAVDLT